jgi:hypothetical protein
MQPATPSPRVARRTATSRSRSRSNAIAYLGPAIFVVGLVLAVLFLPRLFGGSGGLPGSSAQASAPASAGASASAPLPSGAGAILDALRLVDTAIEAARGGKDGLSGRDANELAQLAASVRTAVERGDLGAATTAAQSLSDRARTLTTKLEKPHRDSLLAAIDGLLQALSPT